MGKTTKQYKLELIHHSTVTLAQTNKLNTEEMLTLQMCACFL